MHSRRGFLTGTVGLSLGGSALPPMMTPEERVHAAVEELKTAMTLYEPSISYWLGEGLIANPVNETRFMLNGFTPKTRT